MQGAPLAAFEETDPVISYAQTSAQTNVWAADPGDPALQITLTWPSPASFGCIELRFDTDYDHPLEFVLMLHPETVAPF